MSQADHDLAPGDADGAAWVLVGVQPCSPLGSPI